MWQLCGCYVIAFWSICDFCVVAMFCCVVDGSYLVALWLLLGLLCGCMCLHLVGLGCTWLHLVVPGCTWLQLGVHDCTWLHLVALGYLNHPNHLNYPYYPNPLELFQNKTNIEEVSMKWMDGASVTEMDKGGVYEMNRQTKCQEMEMPLK